MTMITEPELFNMLAQKQALKLELKGLKFSRGSVYAHIKRTYGLRGNKERVYTQFCELCEKAKGGAI
jgi:hypothetical protein